MWGFVFTPFHISVLGFFHLLIFFHVATLIESLPLFTGWGWRWWGGGVEIDIKLSSSCVYFILLLFLLHLPMMPAVAWFLVLLELLQVFGLEATQQWVSILPVVLAILIDQGHLWLAEDGQQVLVLACAGGPLGAAGVQRR